MAIKSKCDGDAVRRLREAMGLTAAELAAAIDIHPGTMSKLETGALNGSPKTRLLLAKALGVPLADIIYTVEYQPGSKRAA